MKKTEFEVLAGVRIRKHLKFGAFPTSLSRYKTILRRFPGNAGKSWGLAFNLI